MAAGTGAVVIAGASGMIGRRLCTSLRAQGQPMICVSRAPRASGGGMRWITWEELPEALPGAEAIVNLAGEPVAGRRWSAKVKESIRASRVSAAEAITRALTHIPAARRPPVLIQASACGIYGDRGDEILDEQASLGRDFLASVCRDWEEAGRATEALGLRCVLLRIGIVLAPEGGALGKMLPPFRMGVGGRLGDGQAWMPWIHAGDLTHLILAMLQDDRWRGPVNACAPHPVRNADFTRALGRALLRPAILPVPAFALRLIFGEGAGMLLASQRLRPAAAESLGFRFRHPELPAALADLLAAGP
jgi:uncharacterized protein (TIGR01777 family)